jgi:streptogramin lyase
MNGAGMRVLGAGAIRRRRLGTIGAALCAGLLVLAVGAASGTAEAGATRTGTSGRASTAGTITNYTSTGISQPVGITSGPGGALWLTNYGVISISRLTTLGKFTNFPNPAVNRPSDIVTGPDGALWFPNYGGGTTIARMPASGVGVTDYTGTGISKPSSITVGPDKALWFTNSDNNSIGRITTAGKVTNYVNATISTPGYEAGGITAGSDGALWFTNYGNDSIGRITIAGKVTNFTGTGISAPAGITAGPDGDLWFTNFGNNSIGRITATGKVTNYTGTGISRPIWITAGSDGNLWFTNYGNDSIGRITTAGTVTNYTGTGISEPWGITAGPDGALWFTNYGNSSVGRITTSVTPEIKSFSPTSGMLGSAVTITGLNLGTATAVSFNGTPAAIVSKTATKVQADVPSGASTGPITVITPAGTAISAKTFKVEA